MSIFYYVERIFLMKTIVEIDSFFRGELDWWLTNDELKKISDYFQPENRSVNIPPDKVIKHGQYSINRDDRCLYAGDRRIALTGQEFEVLYLLFKNNNCIMNWKTLRMGSPNLASVVIMNIRRKIGCNIIKTVQYYGYRVEI